MIKKFEDFIDNDVNKSDDLFLKVKKFNDSVNNLEIVGNNGLGVQILEKTAPIVKMREKTGYDYETLMFGSNSYLNLTNHPKVIEATEKALKKYGFGMGAVSLYSGITDLHRELENIISDFYGTEDTVLFSNGYSANIGIISALCGAGDVIINDSLNHASIFDGSKFSGAELKIYPHSNMNALERILKRLDDNKKGRLIITDGVFSMHGDVAKLDKIVELADKYGAKIMVDDAHGLGIVGKTGRGTGELYNLTDRIDLNVGMLSKAVGAIGGYCATTREIAEYLRIYSRTYFFSTALPAHVVAGIIEIFKLLREDKAGREKLWDNIYYLRKQLKLLGFNIGEPEAGIIPIIIGDEDILFNFYDDLRLSGVYTNVVTYPAIRRRECRLRICVMKDFTKEQMEKAVNIIADKGRKYGIIK